MAGPQCCSNPPIINTSCGSDSAENYGGLNAYVTGSPNSKHSILLASDVFAMNRLITSKDHASVQINIGHLDENGFYIDQFSTFALCGYVRAQVALLSIVQTVLIAIGSDNLSYSVSMV
ncbi:hypothetical protein ACLB2K_059445 [Fragaria x ananassa]